MLGILLADRACPENYRTKPEEPKFKVGDWVRDLRDNSVFQINSVNFNLNLSITNGVYIHWQPKPGEWCWFWVDGQDYPDLRKLNKTDKHTSPYIAIPIDRYKFCEPFIGNLPTLSNK